MKTHDFWIAVARCYGMFEGCVGVYTIPKDHCAEFEQFLDEVKNLGVARSVEVFWSTCFQTVHSRCNWFDQKSENWNFDWDEWIKEIPTEGTVLPYTLVDPEDFPVKGDVLDVLILKEMEKDATIDFTDLAEKLGVSSQLVQYHYHNHVVRKGLIESFEVTAFHFGRTLSDFLFFIFKFDDGKKLAKFALSLVDKPFASGLGKILGENALFGYMYLPKSEFRRFLNALSKLVMLGFVKSYRYVIQDLEASSRQTISYEYFKSGSWIYDHKKHIQNLKRLGIERQVRHRQPS
jgi:DNA-binding Lrp family transcriptional regulator